MNLLAIGVQLALHARDNLRRAMRLESRAMRANATDAVRWASSSDAWLADAQHQLRLCVAGGQVWPGTTSRVYVDGCGSVPRAEVAL